MRVKPFKDRHRPVDEIRSWRHRRAAEGTLHRHKRRVFVLNDCDGMDGDLQLIEKLAPNDPSLPLHERWEARLRVAAMVYAIVEADS